MKAKRGGRDAGPPRYPLPADPESDPLAYGFGLIRAEILRRLHGRAQAADLDDVIQQACASLHSSRAFRRMAESKDIEGIEAFSRSIAKNACAKYFRSVAARARTVYLPLDTLELLAGPPISAGSLDHDELVELWGEIKRRAVARDPAHAALFLKLEEGVLTKTALAKALGVSRRTVGRRIDRIRSYPEVAELLRPLQPRADRGPPELDRPPS